jgi:hypothetical protein
MTGVTHAVTMNGRTSFELKGHAGLSPEEEMIELLGKLNGVQRYSMIVWAIPADRPFDQVDLRSFPTEYIQCACGGADRFICETREGNADAGVQYAVGRARTAEGSSAPDEVIFWNGTSTTVQTNEVLRADEVAELLLAYYRTGSTPSSYLRRKLEN